MPRRRLIRLEDLFSLRSVGRLAIAPDGRRIVFELRRSDLEQNRNFVQLMLVEVGSGETRALTDARHHNDTLPRWSPDGRRVAFISTRDKSACLFVMNIDGGEPARLTDRDGNVSDFDWSPDGARLVYAYQPLSERERLERDEKKDELRQRPQFKHYARLHHKTDGVGWWNGLYRHIYIISSQGGRARQLSSGDYDDSEPRFSPDGRWVSFVSNRVAHPDLDHENADVYLVRPSGGTPHKITEMPGACQAHRWSPDGKQIAFVGNPAKMGESWKYNMGVWLVSASGGKPRHLTTSTDQQCLSMTLGDVATSGFTPLAPLWSADAQRVYFALSDAGATHLYSQGLSERQIRREIDGDVNLMFGDAARPDGPMALTIGDALNPADVYVWDPQQKSPPRRLTQVNQAVLDTLDLAPPEAFSVRSDDAAIHGWMLRPPGANPRRKLPAILQIHGGPHAQYGHCFSHEMQLLAASGFVVVYSNPRGSAGYGLKFMNCIHADWGNLDYRDVMKVTDWMMGRPFVDTKRCGVTGGSYGGYMTNWIIAHTQRFRAALTGRCVSSLESLYGSSDYGHELGYEFGGAPWERHEHMRERSPLTYVKNMRTPLLIEHQEDDLRCPTEQADQLFTALRVLGREVEYIRFEGESHGMSRGGRPHNRAERLRRMLAWFGRHLA